MNNLKGKKVVVTGGAGFIGSHSVDELVRLGARVAVIDNLSGGKLENISHHKDSIEFHKTDILDQEALVKIFKDADAILHLAALSVVPRSIKLPIETNRINIEGTLSVFLAARDANVKRVVYASSSSVYGNTAAPSKVETMEPKPLSPYAVQKYTNELYAKVFHSLFGMETIGLRYFNVFGPRQNPDSEYSAVIPKFIKMIKKGDSPTIFGDGEQARDFTYIGNVVQVNMMSLQTTLGFGEVFNVGNGAQTSVNDLVSMINSLCGTSVKPVYADSRVGDVKNSLSDISKTRKILRYDPSFSFSDGLKLTIESL